MQTGCFFRSFFLGGFECSSHRRRDGKRLDLIAATQHDRFCEADYARLREIGILSARDGIRWHLIETSPYRYDFSSFVPMLRAARKTGMQVIWDVLHYGWPDDLDVFSAEFLRRFGAFVREIAHVVHNESDDLPYFCPVNEISFVAWAAGEVEVMHPFARGRGQELKAQLVRAAITAIDNVRSISGAARFVNIDPIINVVSSPGASQAERDSAAAYARAQFDAWDMLSGRLQPDLGGSPDYVDIIGMNYYVFNQWVYGGSYIAATDPRYRPLHEILAEVYRKYSRPVFVAETGIEGERRPEWLRYICDEVVKAIQRGIPVEGICLYPILNYPGWEDDCNRHAGLWDSCSARGDRELYLPLAREIERQRARIQRVVLSSAPVRQP